MSHSAERLAFWFLCLLTGPAGFCQTTPTESLSDPGRPSSSHSVQIDVFVRSDLDTSKRATEFAEELDRTRGVDVRVHDVLKDRQQLKSLYELSKRFGRNKPVVPSFYTCRKMYFGFRDARSANASIGKMLTVDVYTRYTCQKCQKAKKFIKQLQQRWPALYFRIHEITNDPAARARWQAISSAGSGTPGLPTFDFAGRVLVGYDSDETSGAELEDWIRRVARIENPRKANDVGKPSDANVKQKVTGPPPGLAQWSLISTMIHDQDLDLENRLDDLELPGEAAPEEVGIVEPEPFVEPESAKSGTIDLPILGELQVNKIGLPLFTLAVGLVDGFNPCAMWILVFLLSVLVNIKDRRKILLIAGSFVVVSGIAYFAFMAAWLNVFMLVGIVRPVQIALALLALLIGMINVKDFFAFKKGISLSIPESQKPGLYRRVRNIVNAKYLSVAVFGAICLAVIVNMIELLCTAGLPAVYTQILTMQELPAWQNYCYLALYILAYMFDDTMLLTIVIATLSHRRLQESEGRWLKLISGVVILALGLVMLFKPEWLAM